GPGVPARGPPPRRAHLGAGHGIEGWHRTAHPFPGRRGPHRRPRHPRPPPGGRAGRRRDRGGGPHMTVAAAASSSVSLSGPSSFADVALALCLVAVAVVVSRVRQVGLEGDLLVATFRSFAQLLAIGYVLDYVFKGHGGLTLIVLTVMVGTATFTSGRRGRLVPGHFVISAASIAF